MKLIFKKHKTVLDALDLDDEEPLSLDSFGSVVSTHSSASKCTIFARVRCDSSEKYFYYNALLLNKILFRQFGTCSEYLFRLYAMNPLTNTEISGDVEYFLVSSSPKTTSGCSVTKQKALKVNPFIQLALSIEDKDLKIAEICGPQIAGVNSFGSRGSLGAHDNPDNIHPSVKASIESLSSEGIDPTRYKIRAKSSIHASSSSIASYAESHKMFPNKKPPIIREEKEDITACFIGTDDDFLQCAELRQIFTDNAIENEAELYEMPLDVMVREGIIPPDLQTYLVTSESLSGLLNSALNEGSGSIDELATSANLILSGSQNLSISLEQDNLTGLHKKRFYFIAAPIALILIITLAETVSKSEITKMLIYVFLGISLLAFSLFVSVEIQRRKSLSKVELVE